MNLLTGNDLKTGAVIWWTGDGWSPHIADAALTTDDGAEILARESAAQRVNAAYTVPAELSAQGPLPVHIKDRVRAAGPSVRPDLGIQPELPLIRA